MSRDRQSLTYREALAAHPRVRDLTSPAVRRIEALSRRLPNSGRLEPRAERLEAICRTLVEARTDNTTSLGCEVAGRVPIN